MQPVDGHSQPVNLHQAKTHLSKLVDQAAAGQPVVIARHGRPVAALVAYTPDLRPARRAGGQWKGKVRMAPDFDAFDAELEAMFGGDPA